ncbi:hypothetical protein [Arcticibacter sp. MXS-1]|uniref:hypothetical protein n=1 Tax=Arcticibacter sp. MXS-1 TaxID=3341726 RepID=UPI0035A97D05
MKEKLLIFTTKARKASACRVKRLSEDEELRWKSIDKGTVFSSGSLHPENTIGGLNKRLSDFYLIARLVASGSTFSPGLTSMKLRKGA